MVRFNAADRLTIAALAGLIIVTLITKDLAASHQALDAAPFDQSVRERLAELGFAVRERRLPLGSVLIDGRRGDCRLTIGEAGLTAGTEANFALSTHDVGPVTYLYGGRQSQDVPTFRIRIDRMRTQALALIGLRRSKPAPMAVAAAPACRDALTEIAGLQA